MSGADLEAALEGTALRPKDAVVDAQVHVLAPAAHGVQTALELPAGDLKLEQAKEAAGQAGGDHRSPRT